MIERQREHYEVREVPYGKVYSWRPARVVFECDCGETLTWSAPATLCSCGAIFTEAPVSPGGPPEERDSSRPWLREYEEWRSASDRDALLHEYYAFFPADDDD
ncbi:MAG: hypothetical protein AB1425_10050 [Actinomycetota bacterium]